MKKTEQNVILSRRHKQKKERVTARKDLGRASSKRKCVTQVLNEGLALRDDQRDIPGKENTMWKRRDA